MKTAKPLETREDSEVVTLEVSSGPADRKPNRVPVPKSPNKILENGKEFALKIFPPTTFQPYLKVDF